MRQVNKYIISFWLCFFSLLLLGLALANRVSASTVLTEESICWICDLVPSVPSQLDISDCVDDTESFSDACLYFVRFLFLAGSPNEQSLYLQFRVLEPLTKIPKPPPNDHSFGYLLAGTRNVLFTLC